MTTFSIVIPCYNNYHLLHQLLFDIYKNCSLPDEVIISDNCSTELDVVRGIDWWIGTGMLPIKYTKTEKNDGFLLNANFGLKQATGDVVCLISTDVRIYKDIVQHAKLVSISHSLWSGILLDYDTGWNTFDGVIFPYLEGWLLTTTRENWKRLDYFDEMFAPNDMEDVDLSTKARKLGMTLCSYPEGYVSHLGGRTIGYGTEREEITKRNREKFREKWVK